MVEGLTMQRESRAPTFEDYVAARGRALWRSAWLLTGDGHAADDLLQTALTKCWQRWDHVARADSVEAYVRRVLVTTYIDGRRRRWIGEVPTETLPDRPDRAPEPTERADVVRALAGLPRGQRAVLILRFYEDLTEAQAAEALGVTVGTVKSQTSRALAALRRSALIQEEP